MTKTRTPYKVELDTKEEVNSKFMNYDSHFNRVDFYPLCFEQGTYEIRVAIISSLNAEVYVPYFFNVQVIVYTQEVDEIIKN